MTLIDEDELNKRAREALHRSLALIELNFKLVSLGYPVKLFMDMTKADEYYDFLNYIKKINI